MSFLNHYEILDKMDLALIASSKGYDVYENDYEGRYPRGQLIEMILLADKKAEAPSYNVKLCFTTQDRACARRRRNSIPL